MYVAVVSHPINEDIISVGGTNEAFLLHSA